MSVPLSEVEERARGVFVPYPKFCALFQRSNNLGKSEEVVTKLKDGG